MTTTDKAVKFERGQFPRQLKASSEPLLYLVHMATQLFENVHRILLSCDIDINVAKETIPLSLRDLNAVDEGEMQYAEFYGIEDFFNDLSNFIQVSEKYQ